MDPRSAASPQLPPEGGGDGSILRQVFELTSDAFFLVKRVEGDGWAYEDVNRAAEGFLKATADQLRNRTLAELLPPDLAAYFADRCAQCLALGGPYTYDEEVDLPIGRSYFSTTLIPLRDSQGAVSRIAGICRDVTQRRREEETRSESQKLESLGVMAGGIAHDFNNLLAVALGNLELLQAHLPADHPQHGCLERLSAALLKGADLTRQILAYSGRGRMAARTLDLGTALSSMAALMAASLPKKIQVDLELQPGLSSIEADPAQFQQVVMNLVMNAAEAMGPEVGTITLKTSQETLDEAQLRALMPGQAVPPGKVVTLEVTDTGPGIEPQVLPNIFDPFFSTKATGRGLGLSAVQGILRSHHAGVRVLRGEAKGATFKLYFPAVQATAGLEPTNPPWGPTSRSARILLVDDEPQILEVGTTLLRSLGYEVTTAPDGLEAVAIFKAAPGTVDLVILDVSMPRLDGREAFDLIRGIRRVPVLFCSGFSKGAIPANILDEGDVAFLNKPYRLRQLEEAVRQLLEQA